MFCVPVFDGSLPRDISPVMVRPGGVICAGSVTSTDMRHGLRIPLVTSLRPVIMLLHFYKRTAHCIGMFGNGCTLS